MATICIWGGRGIKTPDGPDRPSGVPANISTPAGSNVHLCPVYMRTEHKYPSFSARDTAQMVVDGQNPHVFLNGLVRPTLEIEDPISPEGRRYWENWADQFGYLVKQFNAGNNTLKTIILDHARYPSRRSPEEQAWLQEEIVDPISKQSGLRVGMYGLETSGPTYWTPYTRKPATPPDGAIPWLIAPTQWRPQNGNATYPEFMWALGETVGYLRADIVAVWCDADKVSERDWRSIIALCTIANGRMFDTLVKTEPKTEPKTEDEFDFSALINELSKGEDFSFNEVLRLLSEARNEVQP